MNIIGGRESNIELLRMVCMFMIALRHFVIHPLDGNTLLATSMTGQLLDAFCYIGVNCFVLISGWFQIKFSWKGLLKLYVICAFYGTLAYIFHLYNDGATVGRSLIFYALFPFSHSTWWFINAYLILYLSSPILNLAAKHLNGNQDLFILLLLAIINVYFGNIMQTTLFNDNGYNGSQMIFMYWIGICLRNHLKDEWIKRLRFLSLIGYIFTSVVFFLLIQARERYGWEWMHLGYNNILTVISACCFFLFFASFRFKSKLINFIGASTLAIYLVQEQSYTGAGFLYPLCGRIYEAIPSLGGQLLFALSFTVCFYVAVILLDQVRKYINSLILNLFRRPVRA